MNVAILTASGIGSRAKQDIPKQFLHINNKPIIIYTLEAFQNHPMVDEIIVVCLKGWEEFLCAYTKQYNITKLKYIVNGGKTGQESIKNGIMEAKKHYGDDDLIIIHDGNRPLISDEIITQSLITCKKYGSAVAAIPCVEAIYKSENGKSSNIHIPREHLFRTQTPHTYPLKKLLWAEKEADKRNIENTTATCTLMSELGEEVYFSLGSEKNLKITTIEDIEIFKGLLDTNIDNYIKVGDLDDKYFAEPTICTRN